MSVVRKFTSMPPEQARMEFDLGKDTRDWKIHLAQDDLKQERISEKFIRKIVYRPFDFRYTYYTGKTSGFICMPRYQLIRHMLQPNLGLFIGRQGQAIGRQWNLIFCGNMMEDYNLYRRGNNACFPLYLYPNGEEQNGQKTLTNTYPWSQDEANGGRVPNLNPEFVANMEKKLGLVFKPNLAGFENMSSLEFGPEDIFHYIYAIFHSPTYRERYAEFLKIDFPRVPLTTDVSLFRSLCELGRKLVGLHLLESPDVKELITRYPIVGDNQIEKGYPKYASGRVNINKTQYFEGVLPELWDFYIGGYQVLDKWLRDRRKRQLSYDDLTHYQQIVVALQQTVELIRKIDDVIPEWPIT
jgi:predicted helicase